MGQTIALPPDSYQALEFLAAGVNGNQPDQTFTVTYTDGTTQTFTQSISDWFLPQDYAGEAIAATTGYRDTADGGQQAGPFNVYGYSFALEAGKTVASITLPDNTNVDILAMSLQAAPEFVTVLAGTTLTTTPSITGTVTSGTYVFSSIGDGQAIADPAASTAAGTQLVQEPADGGPEQQWNVQSVGGGYYTISNVASGLLLDNPAGTQSSAIVQEPADGSDSQLWSFQEDDNGVYEIVNKGSGLVVNIDGGSGQPAGTGLIAWTPGVYSNQQWTLTPIQVTEGSSAATLTDTATLSGGYNPTGTITFTLHNPNGAVVDTETVDVDGNGSYTTPVGYVLPTGAVTGTYQWDATYSGDANNTSASDSNNTNEQVQVDAWLLAAQARSTDPVQGFLLPIGESTIDLSTGAVNISEPLDFAQSDDARNDMSFALNYDSVTVNQQVQIEATLAGDPNGGVPSSIVGTLTLNGVQYAPVDFSTAGHQPGDDYLFALTAPSPGTGVFDWQLEVQIDVGGTVVTQTVSGTVAAVDRTNSPLGAGWGLTGLDQLVPFGGAGSSETGVLWVTGTGNTPQSSPAAAPARKRSPARPTTSARWWKTRMAASLTSPREASRKSSTRRAMRPAWWTPTASNGSSHIRPCRLPTARSQPSPR